MGKKQWPTECWHKRAQEKKGENRGRKRRERKSVSSPSTPIYIEEKTKKIVDIY